MPLVDTLKQVATLTPPAAPELPPVEGPQLEDLTRTTLGIVDRRNEYRKRRDLALYGDEFDTYYLVERMLRGRRVLESLLRLWREHDARLEQARQRRMALLGPSAYFNAGAPTPCTSNT